MTKPMGPIPAGFAADEDGMLKIGGSRVDALIQQAGDTPLFVYDLALIDAKIARFRAAFAGVHLHYAIKANTYQPLLDHIAKQVDGLDIASVGEMDFALEARTPSGHISFAGPGKRDRDLGEAVQHGIILNLESENEFERALSIARKVGRRPRFAVRVNPDFEIKGSGMRMGGGAKPFGIDAARVPALVRRIVESGADWRGFHIFAGSQALDADALIEAQAATLALAARLSEEAGAAPPLVNLGGGFGIPHFHGEQELDVEKVGIALGEGLAARAEILKDSRFAIELGRWLVGECGVYLTRIVDRKVSHGKTFLIVDGGLHHQLAASGNFGQVVRRNYPVAIATHFGAEANEEVNVVGCLCTPLDRLADDVMMPPAQPGDVVAVFLAGAYGLSASPQAFLTQQPALELAVNGHDDHGPPAKRPR